MSRRKIAAANWKMNLNLQEGEVLIDQILAGLPGETDCDIIIAPPFIHLPMVIRKTSGTRLHPAAQHCHFASSGAYTGEVSVDMLKSAGVEYVITGHSERRQLFNESNETIRKKMDAILANGLIPIYCCGESLDIRESGHQNDFVLNQMKESIFHLVAAEFQKVIIAYEPIWAIGTGVTATPEQAQEMHAFLRASIADTYGTTIASRTRILYGGSIKSDNAEMLFNQPDVDGGLVGGASLQASGFLEIIRAACG